MKNSEAEKILLENEHVLAVFDLGPRGLSEKYFAKINGDAKLIAETKTNSTFPPCHLSAEEDIGDRSNVVPCYRSNPPPLDPEYYEPLYSGSKPAPIQPLKFCNYRSDEKGKVSKSIFYAESPHGYKVKRKVSLSTDQAHFRISNKIELAKSTSLEFFVDRYRFSAGQHPDFTYAPLLSVDPTCLSSDWAFKSPAIVIQKDRCVLSLVPDLGALAQNTALELCHMGLNLNVATKDGPVATYGFIPSMPRYHSLFVHPVGLRSIVPPGAMGFSYFLLLFANVPVKRAYRETASFLWRKFGRGNLISGHSAQLRPFGAWRKEAWHNFANKVWFEFDYDGEECGAFRCGHKAQIGARAQLGYQDDGWFCAWWNNLRTAYGLELYSRRAGDREGSSRARRILNLALKAPREKGVFPVLYNRDDGVHHWDRDHIFGGYRDFYHSFDMSWTSYWLLKWLGDLVPEDSRILPLCRAYGDFLVEKQYENGFIPSYYDEDLSVKEKIKIDQIEDESKIYVDHMIRLVRVLGEDIRLNRESAEPAACAVFLAEIHKATGEKKYLEAASKAMQYIEKYIIPENKWFDYETFLSCSRKPYDFYDAITGQHPQNNMCIIQAAKAFLSLYDATGKASYLELGKAVLDYLSLTQQVWSHPLLTPNLIGGFTTQNSDAEWSDARQAYCAILYLDYFERTGNLEYLERGIAALRASFAVAPYENWAHTGYSDRPGALSGFHWGLGSGMTSVEISYERYGDVLASVAGKWAYGINGCSVRDFFVNGSLLCLKIVSELNWEKPLRIVFRDVNLGEYELTINGEYLGEFGASKLKKGIEWTYRQ